MGHVLVLGGARSGKTGFAEALALRSGQRPLYLATAEALDAEMAERVALHRQARQGRFSTVEEPIEVVRAIIEGSDTHDVVLFDCVTLWLTNLLGANGDVAAAVDELVATLVALEDCKVILVSNEVGLGIVPDNPMARSFRDLAGSAHQRLAEICSDVYFIVAGLPLAVKGALPQRETPARLHEA